MKKLIMAISGVIFFMILAWLITRQANEATVRPVGVPVRAFWVGGKDGGVWMDCDEVRNDKIACVIYAEVTGAVIDKGALYGGLSGQCKDAKSPEKIITGYGGDRLLTVCGEIGLEKRDRNKGP